MPSLDMETLVALIGKAIEAGGVIVIMVGILYATARFVLRVRTPSGYSEYRRNLGRALLLGLELLVAGDIVRTVTTQPSLEGVAVLAVIVVIRTFMSFSIELEVEGRFPWQKPHAAARSPGAETSAGAP